LWGLTTSGDPQAAALFAWSTGRRRHQALARRCHYQRRLALIQHELQL